MSSSRTVSCRSSNPSPPRPRSTPPPPPPRSTPPPPPQPDFFNEFKISRGKYYLWDSNARPSLKNERRQALDKVKDAKNDVPISEDKLALAEEKLALVEDELYRLGQDETHYFHIRKKLRKRATVLLRCKEDAQILSDVVDEVRRSKVWKLKKVILGNNINVEDKNEMNDTLQEMRIRFKIVNQ